MAKTVEGRQKTIANKIHEDPSLANKSGDVSRQMVKRFIDLFIAEPTHSLLNDLHLGGKKSIPHLREFNLNFVSSL